MGEILYVVEQSLAGEKLNFAWVFDNVRVDASRDFPFLRPGSEVFVYSAGKVTMDEPINPVLFADGIFEAIRLILEKLEVHPRFAGVHRAAAEGLNELLELRRDEFERLALGTKLRRLIGV